MNFLKNKIQFLEPQMIEGKAKAPEPEDVLEFVLNKFGFSSVLKNKVLMTAGPTIEYIDPVRVITNLSSGKTGVLLASELISDANETPVFPELRFVITYNRINIFNCWSCRVINTFYFKTDESKLV